MNKCEIKIPIYNLWFILVLYKDVGELGEFFSDINYTPEIDIREFDGGILTHNDKCYFLLEDDGRISPGVIAHESKHLVNHIYSAIHCNLDIYNDEPECYLLGWIVDEVHNNINKFKNK